MFSILLVGGTCFLNAQSQAPSENESDIFTEARVALDRYKDCAAAQSAINRLSEEGKKNPLAVMYMARISECRGDLKEAVKLYKRYEGLFPPGQVNMADKIGDLIYRTNNEWKITFCEKLKTVIGSVPGKFVSIKSRPSQDEDQQTTIVFESKSNSDIRGLLYYNKDGKVRKFETDGFYQSKDLAVAETYFAEMIEVIKTCLGSDYVISRGDKSDYYSLHSLEFKVKSADVFVTLTTSRASSDRHQNYVIFLAVSPEALFQW
jgi:hypothetical protein